MRSDPTVRYGPFEELDRDWAALCMQHRRSPRLREWARTEAALRHVRRLTDVIPADRQDRSAVCRAMMRLHQGGDQLAGRALLQLMVPGLVRLTVKWRHAFGGVNEAGWEVIGRAGGFIAHLRGQAITCSPPGYLLQSIDRDIRRSVARRGAEPAVLAFDEIEAGRGMDRSQPKLERSAEDAACDSSLVDQAVDRVLIRAVRRGYLKRDSAEVTWRALHGQSVPSAAWAVGIGTSTAYRYFDDARDYLRRHLVAADKSVTVAKAS